MYNSSEALMALPLLGIHVFLCLGVFMFGAKIFVLPIALLLSCFLRTL